MNKPSPKITFDNRLIAVEEQLKQRFYSSAIKDLAELSESMFPANYEQGLFYLLKAEVEYFEGNYRKSLELGLKAARILAGFPLNCRYGRAQIILSKSYSALGDLKNAEMRARDSLSAYRRATEKVGQVDALNELARISHIRCNYHSAGEYLEDAISMLIDSPRKTAQLSGNLGMIKVRTGQWDEAEENLQDALKFNQQNKEEISTAINLLSLGYLQLRRRHFIMASRNFDQALEIISRLGLKREKVIHLEYAGELAFEKGDIFKAKAFLSDAYQKGMMLAPGSSLVSQTSRRLGEVELALDNIDDAMKYAQKALELSSSLGEKLEIGLSHRVIAQVFVSKGDYQSALEYIDQAVDILRTVDEPYELARTLLVQSDVKNNSRIDSSDSIDKILHDALKIFKKLKLEFWIAKTDYEIGVYSCQTGNLSSGFRQLNRAEKIFSKLDEQPELRTVNKFLKSLSDQAVALSISNQNKFKVFGNLVTPNDESDLESDRMEDILRVVLKKTDGDRAVIYAPDNEDEQVIASCPMKEDNVRQFVTNFEKLLGEEVSKHKPTLLLDCRRDPFINGLFKDIAAQIGSVIVIPFKMATNGTCYLYLDRISRENTLNPFSQEQLNFSVGFSDLIGFKWTEIQKNLLLEDNLRLKSQLMEKATFSKIITQDHNFLEMLAQVQHVVNSSISISIEGDTGCGKDLFARAIHYNSVRRDKRFISVNCAALPESLLESELFGYVRGAFTGADRDKAGLFEEADGGTFFLDEIADMPMSVQAKILRVLESKEIVRLGDSIPKKIDVRILSATNKNLKEQMDARLFRQDLYFRLAAFTFKLPALSERRGDIPLLVDHFLKGSSKKISADVLKAFDGYDWPGNIRELENEIKKLVLLSGDSVLIDTSLLSNQFKESNTVSDNSEKALFDSTKSISFNDDYSLYDFLSEHEKRFIINALKEKLGVKKHAAALLKIPESTLRLKIKQYNIDIKNLH